MSRKIYIIIAMVFMVVLSVSTFFIIRNHIDSAKQNEVYDNLAEIVEDEPPKENEGVTFSEDKDYLAEYLELYRQNEDMVGWIKVEDTNINYPVVQSVNEPNFYLKHKFDKTYSAYGCPYVQENCDVQKYRLVVPSAAVPKIHTPCCCSSFKSAGMFGTRATGR